MPSGWRVRVPVNFDLPHHPRKFLKQKRKSLAANGRVFIFVTVTKITLRLNVGAISRPRSAVGHVAQLSAVSPPRPCGSHNEEAPETP